MLADFTNGSKTCTHFSANSGYLTLRHDVESHNVSQTTALHVLHNDPQVSFHQKAVHKVDNVLMLAIFHDQDLVDDEVLLGLLLEVHLLDSHTLVATHFVRCEHAARSTLANLVELLVS